MPLLLVTMPFVTSSFLLVAMPGATSRVLAPNSDAFVLVASCYYTSSLAPSSDALCY